MSKATRPARIESANETLEREQRREQPHRTFKRQFEKATGIPQWSNESIKQSKAKLVATAIASSIIKERERDDDGYIDTIRNGSKGTNCTINIDAFTAFKHCLLVDTDSTAAASIKGTAIKPLSRKNTAIAIGELHQASKLALYNLYTIPLSIERGAACLACRCSLAVQRGKDTIIIHNMMLYIDVASSQDAMMLGLDITAKTKASNDDIAAVKLLG